MFQIIHDYFSKKNESSKESNLSNKSFSTNNNSPQSKQSDHKKIDVIEEKTSTPLMVVCCRCKRDVEHSKIYHVHTQGKISFECMDNKECFNYRKSNQSDSSSDNSNTDSHFTSSEEDIETKDKECISKDNFNQSLRNPETQDSDQHATAKKLPDSLYTNANPEIFFKAVRQRHKDFEKLLEEEKKQTPTLNNTTKNATTNNSTVKNNDNDTFFFNCNDQKPIILQNLSKQEQFYKIFNLYYDDLEELNDHEYDDRYQIFEHKNKSIFLWNKLTRKWAEIETL